MKCYRNCGLESTHITKTGLHVCHKNAACCPTNSSKGKPRKPRIKPENYAGDNLCDFGCGNKAKFKFNNGKYCCSSTGGNCSNIRKIASKHMVETRMKEIEPGLTLAKSASIKASETKTRDIDENGLNKHIRVAQKISEIKTNKIDPTTGLNVHELTALKYKEWLKTESGINSCLEQSKNLSATQNKIDPTTGEKEAVRRAKIMVETKTNNIDELGLNSFDRTHWKGGQGGFVEQLYYQSSNEKRFLEYMLKLGKIKNLKRGTKIKYNESKYYLPDYIDESGNLYEIKSKYTMFGPNNEYLETNLAKFNAAKEFGYNVILVIDDKFVEFEKFIAELFP